MKKNILSIFVLLFLIFFSNSFVAKENSSQKKSYAQTLPDFSLKDPAGKKQTKSAVAKKGVLVVVTAPILSNKDEQEGWSKYLTETKKGHEGHIVFLEDMNPSSFKGKALNAMKKDYEPGKDPILLVDQKGSLRKKLKVPEKKTVVLAYNKEGKLVASEEGKPNAESAAELWKKIN